MKNVIEQLNRVAAEPNGFVSRVYIANDEALRLRAGLEALALAERLVSDIRREVSQRQVSNEIATAWADALEGVVNVAA